MTTKILVVEDDPGMQTLLKTFLEFEGYGVILQDQYDDLKGLIEKIRLETPEIVLMDVFLGKTNGFDLLAAIRRDPTVKNVGVIMTSGMDFNGRSKTAGADAFLLKPYMPDELFQSIDSVTAGQSGRQRG
jgi:DNA-binding response OmpR family regulator